MSFQFQCPQGHLLEGEESHAGQTCQCPECGMAFIIPMPIAAPAVPVFTPQIREPAPASQIPQFTPGVQAPAAPVEEAPKLLHIPCPQGHELETPLEMLNQDVMCPHCGVQFRLREKDSVEFKKRKHEEDERRLARAGKLWFNWAIAIAVIIVLFLVGLIATQSGQ